MSNTPLTIRTATTTHTFAAYTIPDHQEAFAIRREPTPTTNHKWPRSWGDGREMPRVLQVTVEVEDGSPPNYRDGLHAAYALLADLETANRVGTHEGMWRARGIVRYDIQPTPTSVLLTLGMPVIPGSFEPEFSATGLTFDDVSSPYPRWDSEPL